MLGNLNGWHLVIILAVVLLLFGAPKLPGLARSLGQSARIFKSEVKTMKDESPSAPAPDVAASEAHVSTDAATADQPAPQSAPSKP
jgi:sec-independent protein translocase protein TatA